MSTTSDASGTVKEFTGQAKRTIDDAADSAQDVANLASRQVGAVGNNVKKAIDKSLDGQPYATLGLAVLMGVVLGAIWKA